MILMCTALSFNQFFGRNLDYEFSYGEQVAVTPRNYDFHFRHLEQHESHYALIGMLMYLKSIHYIMMP